MTRDEIVGMGAGRELDALIAEKVMGWTRYPDKMHSSDNRTIKDVLYCPPDFPYDMGGAANCVPYYSSRLSDAWQMVEEMGRKGFWCKISTPFDPSNEPEGTMGLQHAGFTPHGSSGWNGRADYRASHESLTVAICHAALIAKAYYPELPPE